MTKAVIIGYASIDYSVVLDGFFEGEKTTTVKSRAAGEFPRPGGCPLYVGAALAKAGVDVSIVSWVGDDADGQLFVERAAARGIDTAGVSVIEHGSTPVTVMLYQEDGSCGCCFDPGLLGHEYLTGDQVELIKQADIFCVTVGPPDIAKRSLALVSDECIIAWVAKNHEASFPENLRARLGEMADYVFCNQHEREWVNEAVTRAVRSPPIFETAGTGPVIIEHGAVRQSVEVPAIAVDDACGAGDTFAGGCLGAIAAGERDLASIAKIGIDVSGELLGSRSR